VVFMMQKVEWGLALPRALQRVTRNTLSRCHIATMQPKLLPATSGVPGCLSCHRLQNVPCAVESLYSTVAATVGLTVCTQVCSLHYVLHLSQCTRLASLPTWLSLH
jgi:hypothetical protein